jgi:hypothetical protein
LANPAKPSAAQLKNKNAPDFAPNFGNLTPESGAENGVLAAIIL